MLNLTKVKRDDRSRTAEPNSTIPETEPEEQLLEPTQRNCSLGRVPTHLRAGTSEAEKKQRRSQALRCSVDVQVIDFAKIS